MCLLPPQLAAGTQEGRRPVQHTNVVSTGKGRGRSPCSTSSTNRNCRHSHVELADSANVDPEGGGCSNSGRACTGAASFCDATIETSSKLEKRIHQGLAWTDPFRFGAWAQPSEEDENKAAAFADGMPCAVIYINVGQDICYFLSSPNLTSVFLGASSMLHVRQTVGL